MYTSLLPVMNRRNSARAGGSPQPTSYQDFLRKFAVYRIHPSSELTTSASERGVHPDRTKPTCSYEFDIQIRSTPLPKGGPANIISPRRRRWGREKTKQRTVRGDPRGVYTRSPVYTLTPISKRMARTLNTSPRGESPALFRTAAECLQ